MTRILKLLPLIAALSGAAIAQSDTTFTYQGQLHSAGQPVDSDADFRFRLFDALDGGNQIGGELALDAIVVSDGLFDAAIDFGADALNGQRWLEIDVRSPHDPTDTEPFTTLEPRQPITGAPFSIQTRGIFVDENNNVGIGTSNPLNPLHVESDGDNAIFGRSNSETGRGVYGEATASTGSTYGGYFESASTSGIGAYGFASASTGTTFGLYGSSLSMSGLGVFGLAASGSGTTYGVYGRSFSTSGRGAFGWASATSGSTYGGYFESASTSGIGAYGFASASTGNTFGLYGSSLSTSGLGVFGLAASGSGTTYGVYGRSFSTSGRGVFGWASASSGLTDGVFGLSDSTSGRGIDGWASASSGTTYGVFGTSSSPAGVGVLGAAVSNSGKNYGVVGRSNSTSGFDFLADGAGFDYGSTSSRRWKHNIEPISDPLRKLAQLRGVYYDWDEEHGGHHDLGMIAEEVGEVLPEIVNYEANGVDAIGMDYSKMTPLLVESVNALRAEKNAEIDRLNERIAELERLVEQIASNPVRSEK